MELKDNLFRHLSQCGNKITISSDLFDMSLKFRCECGWELGVLIMNITREFKRYTRDGRGGIDKLRIALDFILIMDFEEELV